MKPKQIHWEKSTHRKFRPELPWHIKHAQREKNNGKTDAEIEHEARNAAIQAKATDQDQTRKKGSLPWYVRQRQEKRALKAQQGL